ncbi:hemolysin secretion protein D [Hydrogenophaga sp. Root209]|uniref:efflux RND transporter periplasmic adaptor subunit n=1 Tax=Hydrogenophaga sp. Root209 TaxID=1736490 RepID=UPI0006F85864|nr:efflux RND transporter periplasmic adaptor subunit [Hydrogenophaga sp. Root209]KRC12322.1 hemolysin secretion protein D [Hydrogenophaga sp. Root209]
MKLPSNLRSRLGLGLLGVMLIAALAYVVMRSGPLAPTRATVTQATVGSLSPSLFGIGTVEARRAYLIGPTAAGRVSRVLVDVGDAVKAGQLLAEMNPVDLDERAAALEASIARGGSAIVAAQAQRRDAQARSELAATTAQRYVQLGAQKFMSVGAVEAKQQEQLSAQAAVAAADANLAATRQDVRRLTAERAGLKQQRDNVLLLAPTDGVVISRDAEAGSTVVAGQAVLRLIEPSSLWVRVRLDQGRSAGLIEGLPARIMLRSNPDASLAGRVARVEATSDSITEERVALVSMDTLPSGLTTGELAEVTLTLPPTQASVLLPNPALQRQADRVGVWRIEDGKPRFAPVRIGLNSLDGMVQVLEGLEAGDEVVVYSEKALTDNSRVKVVETLTGRSP